MTSINPHVIFNGNAEEAIHFYQSVFGGKITKMIRFRDLPASEQSSWSEDEGDKIMHITLAVGDHYGLTANDVPASLGVVDENENRSKVAVTAEDRGEAERIFNELSVGGTVEMPIGDAPWGSYFGMFRDRYGVEWTVDCDLKSIDDDAAHQ